MSSALGNYATIRRTRHSGRGRLSSLDISWITCCDHGYGRPSWRPRVSSPATYRSGTSRNQHPAVARWHAHLRGLATAIHEISRLCGRDPESSESGELRHGPSRGKEVFCGVKHIGVIRNSKPVLVIEYWNLIFYNSPPLPAAASLQTGFPLRPTGFNFYVSFPDT